MDNNELIEKLESVIGLLQDDDRESAEAELYNIFDELEFVSEDYDEEDDDDEYYDDDEEFEDED
jgi:hypothetical protein